MPNGWARADVGVVSLHDVRGHTSASRNVLERRLGLGWLGFDIELQVHAMESMLCTHGYACVRARAEKRGAGRVP
jgi:hypothetical protein